MPHHIYKTKSLVLGSFNTGEANRFLYLLTKELGLITASAQSVRELKSKLRFSLQDFSYSTVDLVQGREIWRITNAKSVRSILPAVENIHKRIVFRNIISLTKRLFTGEIPNEYLFDDIVSGLVFLEEEYMTKKNLRAFEIIMSIKILYGLGYLTGNSIYNPFLKYNNWDIILLNEVDEVKSFSSQAIIDINKSLRETHL